MALPRRQIVKMGKYFSCRMRRKDKGINSRNDSLKCFPKGRKINGIEIGIEIVMIFKTRIVLPTKGADMTELAMTINQMESWTYIEKIMSNKNNG